MILKSVFVIRCTLPARIHITLYVRWANVKCLSYLQADGGEGGGIGHARWERGTSPKGGNAYFIKTG